ncbi:Hsp20/alpha crystallin family protein [Nocardioides sp.]|uniref:Hsp20/alpha crystallin family protein n=1 Tax=Nocardioides sp. TaxID=35761 RepID=UPI0035281CE9
MRNSLYVRRDPFRDFESIIRQAFAPVGVDEVDAAFSPAAEVHREGDDALIRLELPGLDIARDVTVEVLGREIVISGERRDERAEESEGRLLREFRYGSFRRSFSLGRPVRPEAVTAGYDAGVLTVRVAEVYAELTGQKIAISTTERADQGEVVAGEAEETPAS